VAMIKRSDRIRKVASLARSDERKQCQVMGHSQRELDQRIQQLEELQSYRQSYLSSRKPTGSVHPTHWQDYQNFLQRLDQAVSAQELQVAEGRQSRDLHRRRWMVKRQRLDSLERVVDRYRQEEQSEQERRQQQQLDDLPETADFFVDDNDR